MNDDAHHFESVEDIPSGQWVKVDLDTMTKILEEIHREKMDDLYRILGESPEAWRGAATLASGLFGDMQEGQEKSESTAQILMRISTQTYMLLEHPLAKKAISDWVEANPDD